MKMPIFYTPDTDAAIHVESGVSYGGVDIEIRSQNMGAVDLRAAADYFADLADLLDGTITAEELDADVGDAMWFLAVHAEPTDDWGDFTFGPVDDDDFGDPDFGDPDFDDPDFDDPDFDSWVEEVLDGADEDIADAEVLNDASASLGAPDCFATAKELPVDEDPDELARVNTIGPYKGMCGYDVGG
jgi:hypothetical protein